MFHIPFSLRVSISAQMNKLFHQVYEAGPVGAQVLRRDTASLLTLHPLKDPHTMHLLHTKVKLQQLQRLLQRQQRLTQELKQLDQLTGVGNEEKEPLRPPAHAYNRHQDVRDFVTAKLSVVGEENTAPSVMRLAERLGKWWRDNSFPDAERVREMDSDTGRVREGEILVADNPEWDYLVVRKTYVYKHPSREYSVRNIAADRADRHLETFLQGQGFSDVTSQQQQRTKYQSYSLTHGLQHLVSLSHGMGSQSFLITSKFKPLFWHEGNVHTNHDAVLNPLAGGQQPVMTFPDSDRDLHASLNAYRHGNSATSAWPDLNILVPLLGRQLTYVRFLDHLTSAASGYAGRVHLRVGVYANSTDDYEQVWFYLEVDRTLHFFSSIMSLMRYYPSIKKVETALYQPHFSINFI